jgi:hypothetical protein
LNYHLNSEILNFNSSKFKDFFKLLDINTPKVLTSTNSTQRFNRLNPFNVLIKHLSRHGLKMKASKLILTSALRYLRSTLFRDTFFWKLIILNLPSCSGINKFGIGSSHQNSSTPRLKDLFESNFNRINLMFSFYIYKVDKQIYKNSRGKSGKFTFIWKYIAPYRRMSRITYWLLKDMKIVSGKSVGHRVDYVLHNFLTNPHLSLVWKIKKFSLNYTYYNLRNSLLETYRTSSR